MLSSDGEVLQPPWGNPALGDRAVPGDYDGDGRADLAVYRQTTGAWLIRSSATGVPDVRTWGAPALGDVPAVIGASR